MKTLMFGAAALATVATGLAIPAPSFAQSTTQSEIVVFGTDPCPRSSDSEIVVCRRLPESMRFRLPEAYRPNGSPQERTSWANKARTLQNVGSVGVGSCSAVGPGGYTGCLTQEIQQSKQAAKQQQQQSTAPEQ